MKTITINIQEDLGEGAFSPIDNISIEIENGTIKTVDGIIEYGGKHNFIQMLQALASGLIENNSGYLKNLK